MDECKTLTGGGAAGGVVADDDDGAAGRGLHSSTYQLNLSRF